MLQLTDNSHTVQAPANHPSLPLGTEPEATDMRLVQMFNDNLILTNID